MGKDILHSVGNGGHCGCETVSREVLPQVEIPEKWTQEPPCFAITIGVRLRSHTKHNNQPEVFASLILREYEAGESGANFTLVDNHALYYQTASSRLDTIE